MEDEFAYVANLALLLAMLVSIIGLKLIALAPIPPEERPVKRFWFNVSKKGSVTYGNVPPPVELV
jgi:hypothetical protein